MSVKSVTYAWKCPDCGNDNSTSLEEQRFRIDNGTLTIYSGFMCMDCSGSWQQTIVVTLGDVLQDKRSYEDEIAVYTKYLEDRYSSSEIEDSED